MHLGYIPLQFAIVVHSEQRLICLTLSLWRRAYILRLSLITLHPCFYVFILQSQCLNITLAPPTKLAGVTRHASHAQNRHSVSSHV